MCRQIFSVEFLRQNGEIKRKTAAFVGGAFEFDPTFVCFDDPVDDRQAQPRAFADFFSGEEGLKNASLHGFFHTRAGVR